MLSGSLSVEFRELGRWWGTDMANRSQAEIGISMTDPLSVAMVKDVDKSDVVGVHLKRTYNELYQICSAEAFSE